ncbi:MAG: vancomycin high temperature exclusion protein [Lentisphaerae bacterium]|nr:vancomycin high temperature exclusion protein [Lentisphaerota bacterium]
MKRKLKVIVGLVAGLAVVAVIAAGALIRAESHGRTYSDVTRIPHRRVGVLLGCSRRLSNGRTNLFFSYRVAAAATLFQAGKIDFIIVSGDNHVSGYDEPTDMKQALVAAGVPAGRIYCDFAGFRTLDSIARAKAVFGQTSITVVSQEFHNQRAIYLARHEGIDAVGFNAREVTSVRGVRTTLREQFARVKAVLDVCLLGTRPKFLGPRIEIGDAIQPAGGG